METVVIGGRSSWPHLPAIWAGHHRLESYGGPIPPLAAERVQPIPGVGPTSEDGLAGMYPALGRLDGEVRASSSIPDSRFANAHLDRVGEPAGW